MNIKRLTLLAVTALLLSSLCCACVARVEPDAESESGTQTEYESGTETETDNAPEPTGSGIVVGASPAATGEFAFLGYRGELTTIYFTINGSIQGEIHGSCKRPGAYKDTVIGYGLYTGSSAEKDPVTGLYGEVKSHEAAFLHAIDKASPALSRAAASGEALTIKADKYRVESSGQESVYFAAEFAGAHITGIELVRDGTGGYYELIKFTYTDVTYRDVPSGNEWHGTWQD